MLDGMRCRLPRMNAMLMVAGLVAGCVTPVAAQWPRFHGDAWNSGLYPNGQGRGGGHEDLWTFNILHYTNSSPALSDLDGDGGLDIVLGSWHEGLFALDGANGSVLWMVTMTSTTNGSAPAIADVDGDGKPEVVFARTDSLLVFQGETGAMLWKVPVEGDLVMSPCAADLDGDGRPEVVFSETDVTRAYDGATGAVLWTAEGRFLRQYGTTTAEDLDGDGKAEVLACTEQAGDGFAMCCLDGMDGSLLWTHPLALSSLLYTPAPAVADLDGDEDLEIVSCYGDNDLAVLDASDGSVLWSTTLPGDWIVASPCLVDADGNGELEILVSNYLSFMLWAFSCDGDTLWTAYVVNQPFGTPAVADIDGDGTPEILQVTAYPTGFLFALDATTGQMEWMETFTTMVSSSPSIGDLDGDGFYDWVITSHDGIVRVMTSQGEGIGSGASPGVSTPVISPSPFSAFATVSFYLNGSGPVRLDVYDTSGRRIGILTEGVMEAGHHEVVWSPESGTPTGCYVLVLRTEGGVSSSRCMLLR